VIKILHEITCQKCKKKFKVSEKRKDKAKFCSYPCYWKDKKGKKWTETFTRQEVEKRKEQLRELHKTLRGRKRPDVTERNKKDNPMWSKEAQEKSSKSHTIHGWNNGHTKAFRYLKPKCSHCNERNPKKLHAHHLDGDRFNNNITNLIILCIKCHYRLHAKARREGIKLKKTGGYPKEKKDGLRNTRGLG